MKKKHKQQSTLDIRQLEFNLVADGQVVRRGRLKDIEAFLVLQPTKPGQDVGLDLPRDMGDTLSNADFAELTRQLRRYMPGKPLHVHIE